MSAAGRYWLCSCVVVLAGCHLMVPYDPVQEGQETGARDLDQRVAAEAEVGPDLPGHDLPRGDLPSQPPDLPPPDLPPMPPDMPPLDLPPMPPDMGCPAGEALCGKVCIKVQQDPNNCGTCGKICDDNNPCTQNNCTKGKCNYPAEPTGTKCTGGACAKVPSAICCTGCLDGDQCRAGTGNSNCGQAGAQCEACTGGLICSNKACSCEPKGGCKGCCTAAKDKCVFPISDSECGVNGVTCTDCTKNSAKKTCQQSTGKCVLGATTTCTAACASGCCSGSKCFSGTSDTDCGKANTPCEDCTTKLAPECVKGYSCGASRTCEANPVSNETICSTGICCNGACLNIIGCP